MLHEVPLVFYEVSIMFHEVPIKEQGIKIGHWSKGPSHLENKMGEIENLISTHRPHLLGISEANLHHHHDLQNVQVDDYDLITCPTITNPILKTSRIVVCKHKSLIGKVRSDLMSDDFSSIWMEVGLPNKKKILVCQIYREHQYL